MAPKVLFNLFVYGDLLEGERQHELIEGCARIATGVTTASGYTLVEVGPLAAIIASGPDCRVLGDVYAVDYDVLARCDVERGHPHRFHRDTITLDAESLTEDTLSGDGGDALRNGAAVYSYLMHANQVRGKRRFRGIGDWRQRLDARDPGALREAGPFVRWARDRYRK